MTILTLVRGMPGSGKSTYARSLGCFHVEDDMFRICNGQYAFDWKTGYGPPYTCEYYARLTLSFSVDVVVSNHFVTREELEMYTRHARRYDASVRVVKCVGRWAPAHPVDGLVLQMMHDQWDDWEGEELWNGS